MEGISIALIHGIIVGYRPGLWLSRAIKRGEYYGCSNSTMLLELNQ